MTLAQFGRMVKNTPKLRQAYGDAIDLYPDTYIADKYLERYPKYWRLISSNGQRLRDLANNPVETAKGFWDSNADFYENQGKNIANRAATINYVERASVAAEASSHGLTVDAYIEQQNASHQAELQIRLEKERLELELRKYWETAEIDLNAADRSELKDFYQLAYLDNRLTTLYKRRASLRYKKDEASKAELRLVKWHIQILEDAVNERQAVVQKSDGRRVWSVDEKGVCSGSGQAPPPEGPQSPPIKGFGMGK